MGYRLVQAVTVVTFGRLGDMFGRVKIYNAGFVVFTVSSILLSVCPFMGVRPARSGSSGGDSCKRSAGRCSPPTRWPS